MATPVVLLAAGDPEVLMHLIREFPRQHWKPMAAKDGGQVAAALDQRTVHIAIVHEVLRDMRGTVLCEQLREIRPNLPIVALTHELPGETDEISPWDIAVRFPCASGVLRDIAVQTLRKRRDASGRRERFLMELEAKAAELLTQDYWQVMAIEQGADQNQLRRAYDRLSLRFHPDRHPELRGSDAEELVNSVYKHIGEAYRVLKDPRKCERYAKQLAHGALRYDDTIRDKAGPRSMEDLSENMMTRRFLKLSDTALAQNNQESAIQNLRFALSMEPGNEEIADKLQSLEDPG